LYSTAAWAAPACIPKIEIPHARIVRIEKNGDIVLFDGRAARLEGILLPDAASDRAPQFVATQAIAALGKIVADHPVALAADVPKEDRYGRIRSQVLVQNSDSEIWVQREMLRRGLARVAIAPDRNECVTELYAAEAEARHDRAGLWSLPAYAVRHPSQTGSDAGTFQIVEGRVILVSRGGNRIFLAFNSSPDSDFAATISADDMKRFREIGVDPFAYENETVRVRGLVERVRGRMEIELATPAQVQIVQPTMRGAVQ
jgi:endonuclease YncB( thermonuclease family)